MSQNLSNRVWRPQALLDGHVASSFACAFFFRATRRLLKLPCSRLSTVILVAAAFLMPLPANATPQTAVTKGLSWLAAQIQPDGSLVSEANSTAQPIQVRSEVAQTLRLFGGVVPASLQSAIDTSVSDVTELLARQALESQMVGHRDNLVSRQLASGAFPAIPGFDASVLDTAWALRALSTSDPTEVSKTVGWLQSQQGSDGQWVGEAPSSVLTTAAVLRSLKDVASQHPVAAAMATRATAYLLAQRAQDGYWAHSTALTALAYEAVHPFANVTGLANEIGAMLLSTQSADGSWQNDPYLTAVALRALHLTTVAAVNPALGSVSGVVIDAATGLPLNAVTVLLYPGSATTPLLSQQTTVAGYAIANISPGSYRLEYQYPQYAPQAILVELDAGQVLEMPPIQLAKLTGQTVTTGTIRGVIRLAESGAVVADASVVLSPAGIALASDVDGNFQFSNVPAGNVGVAVSKAGLQSQSVNINLAAGETYIYSPQLQVVGTSPPPDTPTGVHGLVLDAGSNLPLDAAQVSVLRHGVTLMSAVSGVDGKFSFDAIAVSEVTLVVNKPGYGGTRADLIIPVGSSVDVGMFRLTRDGVTSLLPNLTVRSVNKNAVATHGQTLQVSGTVSAEVSNGGALTAAPGALVTAYYDKNANRTFDPGVDQRLGEARLDAPLYPGQTRTVNIDVHGEAVFSGDIIFVMVDADRSTPETDEADNVGVCSCGSGMPLIDDFSDGNTSNWTPAGNHVGSYGTWIEKDGVFEATGGGASLIGSRTWTDYDVQIRVNFPDGAGNDSGVLFRVVDEKNWYQLRLKDGHARLLEYINGVWGIVAEVPIRVDRNRWYVLKAEVRGSRVRGLIDGQPLFDFSQLRLTSGAVGVEQDGGRVLYDDLRVYATPLFEDDFSDGIADGWSPLPYGTAQATVVNGQYVRDTYGSSWVGDPKWTDMAVQVDMQFPNGLANDGGLVFRANNPPNNTWGQVTLNAGLVRMYYAGIGVVRSASVPISPDPKHVYTFRAEVEGRNVRVFLNDQFLFSDDSLPWAEGAVGTTQDGVLVHYDNLRVYSFQPELADLSASYVRVNDQGPGNVSAVTVRVGNGGLSSVTAGVHVAFYSAAPALGGTLLGTRRTSQPLNPGEFEDVSLSLSVDLSAVEHLWVVVDDDGTGKGLLQECDETNNSTTVNLTALASNLAVVVSPDKSVYNDGDHAVFTAQLRNNGSFSRDVNVILSVESPDGQEIARWNPQQVVALAPGGQVNISTTWNTSGWLAASGYRVRARVLNELAQSAEEDNATFSLVSAVGAGLSVKVQTDRASYLVTDVVRIVERLSNMTGNTVIQGLTVQTTIRDAASALLWSRSAQVDEVALGGGVSELLYQVPLAGYAPGVYSIRVDVFNSGGLLVASDVQTFEVWSTAITGAGLTGTISALPASVEPGRTATIYWSVLNTGNAPLTNLPVRVRVVDPAADALLAEFPASLTLEAGQQLGQAQSWMVPAHLGGKTLTVALFAEQGGRQQLLAQGSLKVLAPPVVLGALARLGSEARVLALASCPVEEKGSGGEAQCAAARGAAMDAALTALGVVHKVVYSLDEFESELQCGHYNTYWLSGGAGKLSDRLLSQLREAVRLGDGLLVDGPHDNRNSSVHEILGVKHQGKLAQADQVLSLPGTSLFPTATLNSLGQPVNYTVEAGTTHGRFPNGAPAIVSHEWGLGQGLLLAFDLVKMLQRDGMNAAEQWLLQHALGYLASGEDMPAMEGDPVLVRVTVKNTGTQAALARVNTQIPSDATFLGASDNAQPNAQGQLSWAFELAAGAEKELFVRVAYSEPGEQTLRFDVLGGTSSASMLPQTSVSQVIRFEARGAEFTDALVAIQALQLARQADGTLQNKALLAIHQAEQVLHDRLYEQALSHWIAASDALVRIGGEVVEVALLAVARGMQATQRLLCETP